MPETEASTSPRRIKVNGVICVKVTALLGPVTIHQLAMLAADNKLYMYVGTNQAGAPRVAIVKPDQFDGKTTAWVRGKLPTLYTPEA